MIESITMYLVLPYFIVKLFSIKGKKTSFQRFLGSKVELYNLFCSFVRMSEVLNPQIGINGHISVD